MNHSNKLLNNRYRDNINIIKSFDLDYELWDSSHENLRDWNGIKKEFIDKRLELVNIILEKKIKIMDDTLVLNKMIKDFMSIDKDINFNDKEISEITYHKLINFQ